MNHFVIGQRWTSEMEPELGVGIVDTIDGRRIHLRFPESALTRIYSAESAPLRRVVFHPGDRVAGEDGTTLTIAEVAHENGLNVYCGEGLRLREDRLSAGLMVNRPNARLMAGQCDSGRLFDLRLRILRHRWNTARSPVYGFVGGRVSLIAHQFAVAADVSDRRLPRVLLADETGLGKTIEAGLILHRLIVLGRATRALVVVPDALLVQWYVELARRFNLRFRIVDEAFIANQPPSGEGMFDAEPLILCGFSLLVDASPALQARLVNGGWDMVVVDEAHRLHPDERSFARIQQLSETMCGLILITATPGQLSARGHFARLQLLDPLRYPDYARFLGEYRDFQGIARLAEAIINGEAGETAAVDKLAGRLEMSTAAVRRVLSRPGVEGEALRERLVKRLIDRYGTGRVVFRTRRRSVAGFPGRQVQLVSITPPGDKEAVCRRLNREFLEDYGMAPQSSTIHLEGDCRVIWLAEFLNRHGMEKILLICRTSQKVDALVRALERLTRIKIGRFHEGLTLVQRDRNAAWFADPEGARLLICSEIGSEGRNFQFARHLILFDLPADAELLEQRIGRLDRIGQTGVVHITVPFVPGTFGEVMARWYHEALDALSAHVPAAAWVNQRFLGALTSLIQASGCRTPGDRLPRLIRAGRIAAMRQGRRLETGAYRLLDLDASTGRKAQDLITEIRRVDDDPSFPLLVEDVLDIWGIVTEPLAQGLLRLSPDHRYAQPLPGFRPKGVTATFDRATALAREDADFLTWEHPLVVGAMDLFIGSGQGNAAFVHLKTSPQPLLLLEMVFLLEAVGPPSLRSERFLPSTPIRVVVDGELNDAADRFSELSEMHLRDGSAGLLSRVLAAVSRHIPRMVDAGQDIARTRAAVTINAAYQSAARVMQDKVGRLDALSRVGTVDGKAELGAAKQEKKAVLSAISGARVRLDAVRLVTAGDLR